MTSPRVSLRASLLLPFLAASLGPPVVPRPREMQHHGAGRLRVQVAPVEHLGQVPLECTLVYFTEETLSRVPQSTGMRNFSEKWSDFYNYCNYYIAFLSYIINLK